MKGVKYVTCQAKEDINATQSPSEATDTKYNAYDTDDKNRLVKSIILQRKGKLLSG